MSLTLDAAGQPFASGEIDGDVTRVNRALRDLVGCPEGELVAASRFEDLIAPEPGGSGKNMIALLLETGRGVQLEKKYTREDGSLLWIELAAQLLYDEEGNPAYYYIFCHDITERMQAEETLRESEAGLAWVQDVTHLGSYVWDIGTGEGSCSDELYRIMGVEKGTIEPTYDRYMSMVHPGDRQRVARTLQDAVVSKVPGGMDYRIVRPDGAVRWVHGEGKVVCDENGRTRMYGTVQDITRRKHAEEALRDSEEKFRALTETASAAICILQDAMFRYINPATETITGYTREELLSNDFMSLVHPDFRGYVTKLYAKWLLGLIKYARFEIKIVRKDRDERWIDISVSGIDYRARPGLMLTAIDVTERKRAEEEVKTAKAQAELYLDLMGHDINNMHQIALGYLELARDLIQAEEGQKEYIEKPIEVLQRSAQLISNVRKMQKLLDGSLQHRVIDVQSMLSDVQREYGSVPHKPVTLKGDEHCHVKANELLHDVFANLVTNAIKHTGDTAEISIACGSVKDNGRRYCRVSVEDNGPGIPDDFKAVIFNRMLKGTRTAKGMGLGLYLVKSLVESYRGRVWAEDRVPGDYRQGAKLVVMLPCAGNE